MKCAVGQYQPVINVLVDKVVDFFASELVSLVITIRIYIRGLSL